ncbi:CRISPR-associated helicase Cas3' [Murimonas intestini]|uniref:CRISPR-associated helicase Cas3' n=1 Tax=Murimonas intestini TaxID=1337051 RepID=UPI0011DDE76F|nr:CRISPR-associated helicase Cas3' [Murimonas intestini]
MYLAHISKDKARKQSVCEHLNGTAILCGEFSSSFDCREWGYGGGLVHDIGKYSKGFQKRLLNCGIKVDHATAGAKELYSNGNILAAYCVAGHHSGLPDGGTKGDASSSFYGRMAKNIEDYEDFHKEIEIPAFHDIPLKPIGNGGYSVSFFIRMLFSCLVDADYLDTEEFMSDGGIVRGKYDSMEVLLQKLLDYVKPWLENDDSNTVNGRRTKILRTCMEKGDGAQGLYRLTVPTGGGKTISSLAFALKHAVRNHMDRIIYVIPYTSIIEQNSLIFKKILGVFNVLEDHSNVVYEDGEELELKQLAAENWDLPVVVTTNVQFFESLYHNKTSKCRKLHNISRSVIIFDEAQMLPVNYLKPCIQAINELVWNYHCTAVICTATQPAFQNFFISKLKAVEICPDVKEQYQFFKRTEVIFKGEYTEESLIKEFEHQHQALCILNNRKRVQIIFENLSGEGIFHLSTFMYPKHRSRILDTIRRRLKKGEKCLVIATSLVEAGVDFDFNTVYRELAGLDSVIQAAGRCNREGKKNKNACQTIVFTIEDDSMGVPAELKLPIEMAKKIVRKYEDISSLDAIKEYFELLYHYKGSGLDVKDIVKQFEDGMKSYSFPFKSVAEQFKLIESNTVTILIDKEEQAKEIVKRIQRGEQSRELMREAGQYCINIYKNDFENLNGAGLLKNLDTNYYLLRNEADYTEESGLKMEVSRGDAVMF